MKKRFKEIIRKRLVFLLNEKNLKPENLAYQSGVSKSALSEIINSKKTPTQLTIAKFCAVFGITLSDFYDFEEVNEFVNQL